jgi:transcriptional regulator with GAF, ATPase, and Fis domain
MSAQSCTYLTILELIHYLRFFGNKSPDCYVKLTITHFTLRVFRRALSAMIAAEENPTSAESITSWPWTRKLELFLARVGAADVPVLLQGETGVGKEVLARRICACSSRANKPFLKLNCAALPAELVESELFGYDRGAFTGAFRNTPGKFEMADGGTILLDEIGDMDVKLQAKLLQVLQDGEFLRLGAKETVKVDVRVIAATHCDLERAIRRGAFREDLYYRINIMHIEVPPLRDRREEILPLARFFIGKHSRPGDPQVEINQNLSRTLMAHSWPGNIRELENVIRKLVVLREPDWVSEELRRAAARRQDCPSWNGTTMRALDSHNESEKYPVPCLSSGLGEGIGHTAIRKVAAADTASSEPSVIASSDDVEDIATASALRTVDNARRQGETDAILAALNATLWNRRQAAELLNIEYKALLYRMKRLGIGSRKLAKPSATHGLVVVKVAGQAT